jgi:hypothetical protein
MLASGYTERSIADMEGMLNELLAGRDDAHRPP